MQDIICIIIITDAIYTTKNIFDIFIYPYQLYTITIFSDLRKFFNKNTSNSISFWDCPSNVAYIFTSQQEIKILLNEPYSIKQNIMGAQ